MRKILAVLLSVQLLVPVASARTIHDWSNLEKLELDDPLLVVLQTGEKIRGHFIRISEETLSLGVSVPSQFGATYLREIVRADIRKIELVRRAQNLPNPRTWVIGGALIGGAAGVGLGIHRDISEPTACGHACWFLGGAAGAGLGVLAGLMAAAIVGIGRMFRRNKLIYEDTTRHGPRIH
jgi:hypothetical protein